MSKNKITFWYIFFGLLAWLCLLTPLGIWIGINFNKYVVHKSGMSVTVGGVLAILYVVLLLKYGLKRFGKVFWMTILLVIVYLLNTIIVDALPITFFSWLGVILFSIFEKPMLHFKKKLEVYKNEEIRVTVRNTVSTTNNIDSNGRC